jgi:hypothetical protein
MRYTLFKCEQDNMQGGYNLAAEHRREGRSSSSRKSRIKFEIYSMVGKG